MLMALKKEESEVFLSREGVCVHMRIPAERDYLNNALMTLREICEHFSISLGRSQRIILAFEEALLNAMEHAYSAEGGLIDLEFSVEGSEFSIIVEDFGCGIPQNSQNPFSTEEEILRDRGRGLAILKHLPDKVIVESPSGRGTRTTMLFYLSNCD